MKSKGVDWCFWFASIRKFNVHETVSLVHSVKMVNDAKLESQKKPIKADFS